MRAPIPEVQNRPIGSPRVDVDTRGTQGEQVGAAMGQLAGNADRMAQQYEQAVRFHDTAQINKAATDFEERTARRLYGDKVKGVRGVLEAEGEGAFEAAYGPKGPDGQPVPDSSVYDALQKDREEIAKALGNDRQRQLFDEHVRKSMVGVHRQVEAHVTAQSRVAANRTAEARAQIELNKVANTFADPESREEAIAAGADALRATALSKEDGEARALKFKATAAKVTVAQFLAVNDVKRARDYFATVKETLGPDSAQVEYSIEQAEKGLQAEVTAMKAVDQARDKDTKWVNEASAFAFIDSMAPGPDKDEARQRLVARLRIEDELKKNTVAKVADRAFSAYLGSNTLGAVDPTDKAWLIKYAPDEWDKIRSKAMRDAEHWRVAGSRKREPTPSEREAFVDFLNDVVEHPANYAGEKYTTELFRAQWGPLLAEDDLDRAGRIVFGPNGVKAEQYKGAGEFGRFIAAEINGNPTLKTPEDQKRFRGFMGEQRRAHISQHKREPTLEEMEGFRTKAFLLKQQKRGPWGIFGTKEVPAYKAAADAKKNAPPPPPPKKKPVDRAIDLKRAGVTDPKTVSDIIKAERAAGLLE